MIDYAGFTNHQVKSLKAVAAMVTRNGGIVVESLKEAAKEDLIEYIPGEKSFKILGKLNEKQKKALEFIKKNVFDS
jgi:hypothetical protein